MPLVIDRVSFAYARGPVHGALAVDGVSLTVEPGELTLLIGPTGSGKSTLMRLAAGLLAPDSGQVLVNGRPNAGGSPRGALGLVFQEPETQLFADTVRDDVAFGPRNLGHSADEVSRASVDALVAVGLDPEEYGGRSPFGLSGGEARRAAIAGVLAMRPRYLLADEPTAGLDAPGRKLVTEALLRQKQHAGVVVVSHHAEEFLGQADRLVMMSNGAVAWQGVAAEAVEDPRLFALAGLPAPGILGVQADARACGRGQGPFTLDPEVAAERLVGPKGEA